MGTPANQMTKGGETKNAAEVIGIGSAWWYDEKESQEVLR